ncbi:MAG TPA: uracil-DNA glycosylase [Gemmatimonadaceae bacterium]|nr:uracil-DNA glycosylase [Gemmatimonadaceae bacterium]
MDAREQLRMYLEQRREAGERDLVLDQLSIDAVLSLLGAREAANASAAEHAPSRSAEPATRGAEAPPASGDWREVLRNTGAAPTQAHSDADVVVTPAGLTVGGSGQELFGALAHLESVDDVAGAIASCTRCPLYSTATNPVPGVGHPAADLMIVGEAPGQTEDETGLPFVGAAGQLLTKILAAVDLKREDVFIVNVLKHRPPGNRNPMPDEVTACSPFLFRQFELIRPKAILALGTFAAQTLLQTKLAIGKLRSQVHRFHGVPLIVTYHPAALLRNPSWKRPTWEDVQLVRRILDSAQPQS